jgi:polyisoprenoid-binding protein YceI
METLMTPWTLDPAHSTIGFSVRHLTVSRVHGTFRRYTLDVEFDPEQPEQGRVTAIVESSSVDTGEEQRDAHLRSADFLDAEGFPTLAFTSTGVEASGHGQYALRGDLTMRGVTRPVTFDVEFIGEVANAQGGRSAGFSAATRLSRHDWGLVWNVGLEAGGLVVSDEVRVDIDIELVQAAPAVVGTPILAATPA